MKISPPGPQGRAALTQPPSMLPLVTRLQLGQTKQANPSLLKNVDQTIQISVLKVFYDEVAVTAVFLVSSGGQCGEEQNMIISTLCTYRAQHLQHIGPKVAPRLW